VLKVPPPRYKIVERNRRLVTIDTWSGEVVTTGSLAAARVAEESEFEEPAAAPSPWAKQASLPPLANANPARTSRNSQPQADNARAGKVMILVIAGIVFVLFLILSGAWIPVGIVLLIPAVRTPIWNALRGAIGRYLSD
jgi:hypothetical protein